MSKCDYFVEFVKRNARVPTDEKLAKFILFQN